MKEKTFSRLLCVFVIVNVLYLLATVFISKQAMGDDLEHIHASWLVWLGQIPYTDFFEHHHPLIWYLFAPLVGFFEGKILVFFVIRFLMCLVSLVTLYVIYRLIKDFLGDKIAALSAVSFFCFSNIAMDSMVQFKPDTFMHLFFFWGLYFFFAYLRDKKQLYLNVSALLFAFSFLFLQTVLFLLLPLGCYGVYLWITKEISFKNIIRALPWFLLPLLLFVGWLWHCDNLQRYFETNWLLNTHILEAIWDHRIEDFSDLYFLFALGTASAIYLLMSKPNRYVYLLLIMFVCEFVLRTTYISIWIYYFKILILYSAILIALVLARFYWVKKWTAWLCLPIMIIFCGKFWFFESEDPAKSAGTLTILRVSTTIAQNSEANDIILGTPGIPLGVFNKNPHYYWFSWNYMGYLDERYFHYAEPFDINKIIIEKKPKFIYYEDFKKEAKDIKEKRIQYTIQPPLIRGLYHPVTYDTLFVRND